MNRPRAAASWAVGTAVVLLTAGMAWGQRLRLQAPMPGSPACRCRVERRPSPGSPASSSDTPRGVVLLQVIRVLHEAPVGSDAARDERIRRIRAYIADVSDLPDRPRRAS